MASTLNEAEGQLPLLPEDPDHPGTSHAIEKPRNRGAMRRALGMPPLTGPLSPPAYRAEVARRQGLGGAFAAGERVKAMHALRLEALRLADIGLTEREIAKRLEISPATAHRWTKTPNAATRAAMKELEAGAGERFTSVEALVRDLKDGPDPF